MASTKEIRQRILSVQNTAQITNAMQMVSASKMKKAQDRAIESIPYAQGIYEIVNRIGKITDYSSPYLRISKEVKNIGIVVIGTSRGFVGSMITSLILATNKLKEELIHKYPQAKISGISIHKTAQRIMLNAGIESTYHFSEYCDAPTTTELTAIFDLLVKQFESGNFDEIYLIYTHFINTVVQKPVVKKLLPLRIEEILEEAEKARNHVDKQFIYEPDVTTVLDRLLPEYFQTQIYTGVLESIASENSARMVAMKNATDNANELTKKLKLKYNRQRQTTITNEIIDVINGSIS